ncbi:hypothetical protein EJ04DRAFT_582284 [Polyplosphaeria fusca]|uniref:beta-galactosidase n=1 Tax=Polyplosphaeria fusca TaxID=682080 RepID=A0A9P4UVP9_9PLEO|nr:hypothetical protein EJ04DRAFT_582284 [Polyplosphaeria fusca]
MRALRQLLISTITLSHLCINAVDAQAGSPSQWPLHDNGLNDVVQWDHYSFKVNGKRLFVFSGELHYWRIPVPEVWEDILEKIKAAGFTAFAFYGHWGYHSPNNKTLDFSTGAHDFSKLFDIAKRVGLYVIVRPGPYVNAEANAGGFPLWLTTGAYGELRNDDPRYLTALEPYFSEFSRITSEHLVTKGGNVLVYQIENEYGEQWNRSNRSADERIPNVSAANYMAALEKMARDNGIDVPLIHNDPNMNTKAWSKDFAPNATGNVDVAGLDSYPSCWSCNLDECTGTNGEYVAYQVVNYYDHFAETSPTQPSFFPEFQGGSYNPWGGPEGGCPGDIGADFANLFYRNLISQRVTAISLYMMYGGTNWGALAAPVVATSYDYSSPISESRQIGSKFYETKNLALFTRVAEDLIMTDRLGNSTGYTTNQNVVASELRNPDTNGAFYVTSHSYSPSGTKESFKLHVSTSIGNLTIPQSNGSILLNGHQSKIVVTDFRFGDGILTYSTAEVLTYAIVDGSPILALWAGTGDSVEFHLKDATNGTVSRIEATTKATFHRDEHGILVNLASISGFNVLEFDNGVKMIIADKPTAYLFWAPNLSNDPFAPVDQSILVHGPYLVRSASITDNILSLTGDIANATTISAFAPKAVTRISWNGHPVQTHLTPHGILKATLPGPQPNITLPLLSSWKVHDALPELHPLYNDSGPAWTSATHTTTSNPTKPLTLPVLYVDDYAIHNSFHIFRARFTGPATSLSLSIAGGLAFGYSAWLNGHHLTSYLGSPSAGTSNLTLPFPNNTLSANGTNILVIAMDNTGHDLRAAAVSPRGILAARLHGADAHFSSWKISRAAGGDDGGYALDPVRAPLNEGGLVAERLGWHLPGFNDSAWEYGAPSTGFEGAGISFYRTSFKLDVPQGLDVGLRFVFQALGSRKVRVQLFVNGWQYGRFNAWVGKERGFAVPPGVLDYVGENVVGVSVWGQGEGERAKVGVGLEMVYAVESSWDARFEGGGMRTGWSEERLRYG